MATIKGIQLLSTPNQGNTGAAKKSVAVASGEKVSASADTIYEFIVDEQPSLPKGTKIVKREKSLDFELPDGRVFQFTDWCGVDNSKLIGLAEAAVYDEESGKWIDGVQAIESRTCAWAALNGTAGTVGVSEGFAAAWLALGIPLIAIAAGANSGSGSGSSPGPAASIGPTITGLTAGTNSGLAADQVTNVNKPSLTGKGTPGDQITVTMPTGEVAKTTVDASGNWTVTLAQALPEGASTYQVVAQSPGATPSAPVTAVVIVDTISPVKPNAILNAASDSGTSGDNTTDDATPTISGSGATAGDTITVVTPKGEVLTTTVAADGTWSVTPTIALALGAAAMQITETDPTGNVSVATKLDLVIVGPVVFTVAVPEGPIINLAESTSGGGVPVAITLPPNARAGDVIKVSIDGSTPVSYTVVAADVLAGSASVLIPTVDVTAAGQGPATVTTTYKDANGIIAGPVTTTLTIDTVAPAGFVAAVAEGPVINIAESLSDGGVPVTITLPATKAAGDVITVSIDGSPPVSFVLTTADALLTTVNVLIPTADVTAAGQGPASVTVTYTDAQGNAAPVQMIDLIVDTEAPADVTVSIAEGAIINLAESTTDGGVPVTINLPTNKAVGDVITVSIDGSVPISYSLQAADILGATVNVTLPTAVVNAAQQGQAIVTTTYADANGNAAPAVITTLTIDTIAPTLDLDGNNSNNRVQSAADVGLFNTGVNADGSAALADGVADSHYALSVQPTGGALVAAATGTAANPSPWSLNDVVAGTDGDFSAWIGDRPGSPLGGEYQWTTTFNIAPGTDLSTILLKFDVAADNYLTAIKINGITTGFALDLTSGGPQSNFNYTAPNHAFAVSGATGFTTGANTITFVTYNGNSTTSPDASPVGLRVDNLKYASTGADTVNNLNGFTVIYTEGAAAKAIADSSAGADGVAIVEVGNIQSATITLTNFQANDVLSAINPFPANISASVYNPLNGVLTLTGIATVAEYTAALKNIGYSNPNADSTPNPVRSITFTLTDEAGNGSSVSTSTVTVVTLAEPVAVPPVVLDLNNDGRIDYSQITMDVNSDGILDRTAWAGPQDGILVWDKFQNGQVTDASQYEFTRYGGATDLSGLAAGFDSHQDGIFDAQDTRFTEFAAWRDINQNGISDAGEVLSLSALGITSISLVSDGSFHAPAEGVEVAGRSHATLANGGTMLVDDATFSFRALALDDLIVADHSVAIEAFVVSPPAASPPATLASQLMLDNDLLLASQI